MEKEIVCGGEEIRRKQREMRVSSKDKRILKLMERWKYVSSREVCYFLEEKWENNVRSRLKKLSEIGAILREKIYTGEYVYSLESINKVSFVNYRHEYITKLMAKRLSEKSNNAEYLTPIEIKREEHIESPNAKVPDLILLIDGKQVAIEIELSQKHIKTQTNNLKKYQAELMNGTYAKVIYFCQSEAIKKRIETITGQIGALNIEARLLPKEVIEKWEY